MPELPEVEIVARSLDGIIRNRRVATAKLLRQRLAPDITPSRFTRGLKGAAVNFVHRRGKHILFDLDNDRTLITHLRMSGKFRLLSAEIEDPKYTHAVFHFEDGSRLVFEDQRHFGLMKLVRTRELAEAREIAKLAPEPFSEDFTVEYLRSILRRSKRTLKEVLLDQTKVCGLGNIYASEAMFLSRANPRTRADRLSKRKTSELFENIRLVLSEAIGVGVKLPVDPENIGGSIYGVTTGWKWRVYDRENDPCDGCSTPIGRIVQAGRSTYFCRKCQR
jgi:formamidopyrimidine-DNA glycosylase